MASGAAPNVIELKGGMSVPAPMGVVWGTGVPEEELLADETDTPETGAALPLLLEDVDEAPVVVEAGLVTAGEEVDED